MKLYILRWNPTFSSMTYEAHLKGMKMLRKSPISSNWSIHDHENLEAGDIYIFNLVGGGDEDGIAGIGKFTSEPYTAPSWRKKDGTNLFYADMQMSFLIDRKKTDLFSAAEMEKVFPEINWHSGHAGVTAPEKIQEDLIVYIMKRLLPLKKPTSEISFFAGFGEDYQVEIFANAINGCCPNLKQKIIERNIAEGKLQYKFFKKGDAIDKSLLEIVTDRSHSDASLSNPCTDEELEAFFVAEA